MSHHTLQLKIVDIIYDCLQNWTNQKYDITVEGHKLTSYSLVFIKLRHKGQQRNFFKSGIKIHPNNSQDAIVLEEFLSFLNHLVSLMNTFLIIIFILYPVYLLTKYLLCK